MTGYELDWEVEVCEFFDDDCDDAVMGSKYFWFDGL